MKKRYGIIDGIFVGYSNGNNSSALVTYLTRNSLEISVTELDGAIWLGFISLYNEKNGTIDWNYISPDEKIKRFGLKKIIIVDKDNFKLIGDKHAGFGIENFTRHPIKEESNLDFIKRQI